MPLKLIDNESKKEVLFENIQFIPDEVKHFRISSGENVGLNFRYWPIQTSDWDKDRFEIFILENPYLNAENDVFEVYEKDLGEERVGWVFPITILESNENDYNDFKNLNQYKYIVYQKLFELDITVSGIDLSNEFQSLSEVFGEIIICVLSSDTIHKIPDFNFDNYLLSLYKNGYLIVDKGLKAKAIYDRTNFISEMRDRKRLKLIRASFDINNNDFAKSLFKEHLLQSENYIIRFIFLYQLIEHFMQIEFDIKFQSFIQDYQDNKLAKNDLKESILSATKERELIRILLTDARINNELRTEFATESDFLFNDIGIDLRPNFSDKVYDIRNLITHRLRDLTLKEGPLTRITEIFERIIVDLLINY